MRLGPLFAGCAFAVAAVFATQPAAAQTHPEFVPLGRVSAALYKPDSGPAAHIVFLIAHRTFTEKDGRIVPDYDPRLAGTLADIDIPYEKFVMPNGLTLIVHEDHKAPIVAVNAGPSALQ